ncbi:MAG: sensor histidine kinase, partial [Alloprevotella sp.]
KADPTLLVAAFSAQGVYLRSLGRIEEALKTYHKGLEIVTSGSFRKNPSADAIDEIASLYINLAVLNLDMQNKEEAARNAEFAGSWAERSQDTDLRSTIFGVTGSVLTGCGKLEAAMKWQDKAYADALRADNREAAFRAAAYAMLIADRMGNKTKAQQWRKDCQHLLPAVPSPMARLVYYQAECSIALQGGNHRDAISFFEKILRLDGIANLPFVQFDCYNNLHRSHAALGNYREAYSTLLKANELRDTLWQQEKAETLQELTVKYETKETELALAQSETRRARTLMWLFAALGLLLAAVVLFVVYAGRQRRRRLQNEMEFARLRADVSRQYVEGLESERRRMAGELHDGVCNDLLAVKMRLADENSSADAAKLIEHCRESVRRISHELMPPEFAYATLDEVIRFFVHQQAEAALPKIVITYASHLADGTRWEDIPDTVALEVYRIVQEAVGNAVKHSGADAIAVELRQDQSALRLSITDNGKHRSTSKRGLGLDSMRRRAAAIGGKLTISRSESGGTTVRMEKTTENRN